MTPIRTASRCHPAGLPVVTTAQVADAAREDSPRYAAGYRAGARWARRTAAFADLDALAQDGRCLFAFLPSWTRGFVDGATAARAKMGAEPIGTTAA